jgi:hypothetical protein
MIVDFYDAYTGGQDRDIGFDTLISGFLFAHGIGEKKTLKHAVRRILLALLVDRGVLRAASPPRE